MTNSNQALSFIDHLELEVGKHSEEQEADKERTQVVSSLGLEEEEIPQ